MREEMGSSNAQLTEEAMWAREWEGFPRLGELLGGKRIPDHYFGYSSASDNVFDEIHRLMRISSLVRENLDQLKSPGLEPTNETEEVAQVRLVGELHQALEVTDTRRSLTD